MTDRDSANSPRSGLTLMTTGDRQTKYMLANTVRRNRSVRVVRGDQMATWDALFAEMSSSFQFFVGWGWNLDALLECLRDPGLRFPDDARVCVIIAPEKVLADEPPGELEKFVECILDASQTEDESPERPGSNRSPNFHIVLLADGDIELVRRRWMFGDEMWEERVDDGTAMPPFFNKLLED